MEFSVIEFTSSKVKVSAKLAQNIDYLIPIKEDFVAECDLTDEESKRKLIMSYFS